MKKILIISIFALFSFVNIAIISNEKSKSNFSFVSLLNLASASNEGLGEWWWESDPLDCKSYEIVVADIRRNCSSQYYNDFYTYREVDVRCQWVGSGPCAHGLYIKWEDCTGRIGGCNPTMVPCGN